MAANQGNKSSAGKRAKTGRSSSGSSSKGKRPAGNNGNNKAYHDEITLISTLVVSLLLILSYFNLSGSAGKFINGVTFGIFGFLAYLLPYFLFIGVAFYMSNRKNKTVIHKLTSTVLLFIVLLALIQLISGYSESMKLWDYCKVSAAERNGGGLIGGLLCKLLCPLFGVLGTYIILIAVMAVLLMFITEKLLFASLGRHGSKTIAGMREKRRVYIEQREMQEVTQDPEEEDFVEEPRRKAKTFTFPNTGAAVAEGKQPEQVKPVKGRKTKKNFDMEEVVPQNIYDFPIHRAEEANTGELSAAEQELALKFGQSKDYDMKVLANQVMSGNETAAGETAVIEDLAVVKPEDFHEIKSELDSDLQMDMEADLKMQVNEMQKLDQNISTQEQKQDAAALEQNKKESVSEISISKDSIVNEPGKEYKFPPIHLLSKPKEKKKNTSDFELKETAMKLQKTLESFGVKVTITNVSCGPAVTRYELQPEQGVKVSKITSLSDDIKLNLAAADIRIEAPIPGKAAVGIEVPNKTNTAVMFRELIENPEFVKHSSDIAFAVGKDIGGQTVVTDIAKMPHLLIAGATGSGKSVCINTLIMSILYKANPADVKLIMVDPKVVELSVYNGIPHLLIPVVTDPKKASAALNWAVMEMTERYNKFAELGVRDIKGYNEKMKTVEQYQDEKYQKMPQIVIIVDELADLMMVAPGEVEDAICRLAQMARAAGLHLIIATQRPSVNVITGLIKANVPSRIAFSVSSAIDSRTIIDGSGAEKLLGKGDMLFFPSGYPKPVRIQGAFVSDKEVSAVVEFLAGQNSTPQYSEEIASRISTVQTGETGGNAGTANDKDDYFIEAGKFIIDKDKASIGMLQRVYKVGFNRAARIMDQLCEAGVVGPEEGTKPRKILMSLEEFEEYVDEYV